VASLVCEGPYQDASQRWPLLIAWVVTHGYSISGAPMQVYTGEPDGTGARGPRTELRLPVERAE
jgi:effector-binding domain-containing protein